MAAANRHFIAARVAEARQQSQLPDFEQLGLVARYWFTQHPAKQDWNCRLTVAQQRDGTPETHEQWNREAAVSSLDDITALPHVQMDGTDRAPPRDTIDTFMRVFEAVVNDHALTDVLREVTHRDNNNGNEAELRIAPLEELAELLKYTGGVYDVDFRHSGISNFPFLRAADWNKTEQQLYDKTGFAADPEPWEHDGIWNLKSELDIAAGLLVDGAGCWPDNYDSRGSKWFSLLAYCRPQIHQSDLGVPKEEWEPFKWRIVLYCHTGGKDFDL